MGADIGMDHKMFLDCKFMTFFFVILHIIYCVVLAMIENYPNVRRRHCETGAFVSMMEFLGYKISEPMTFGIGSGLYFLYRMLWYYVFMMIKNNYLK